MQKILFKKDIQGKNLKIIMRFTKTGIKTDKIEIQSNLELISQGIKEFENFIQSQGYEFRFMSPLEVDIAFNDAKHLLNRWKSENRSHTETYRFLKSNPNVDALVKDFYPESPRYLSIQKSKINIPID